MQIEYRFMDPTYIIEIMYEYVIYIILINHILYSFHYSANTKNIFYNNYIRQVGYILPFLIKIKKTTL